MLKINNKTLFNCLSSDNWLSIKWEERLFSEGEQTLWFYYRQTRTVQSQLKRDFKGPCGVLIHRFRQFLLSESLPTHTKCLFIIFETSGLTSLARTVQSVKVLNKAFNIKSNDCLFDKHLYFILSIDLVVTLLVHAFIRFVL